MSKKFWYLSLTLGLLSCAQTEQSITIVEPNSNKLENCQYLGQLYHEMDFGSDVVWAGDRDAKVAVEYRLRSDTEARFPEADVIATPIIDISAFDTVYVTTSKSYDCYK